MAAETIDHSTLTELVEAGALRGAHVVGQPGGWSLRVKYGAAERALAAQRSRQVRVFRRIETLVSYLKDVGIEHFDVDAADYEAEGGRTRPDRAEAMRRAQSSPPNLKSASTTSATSAIRGRASSDAQALVFHTNGMPAACTARASTVCP